MPNDRHDEKGRFASGSSDAAASGDHASVSPSTATRNVPGHGTVPRSKVVAKHAGAESVGTSSPRLSAGARDRIIRQKGTDQRLFPNRGPEATAATDLGSAAKSGRFDARGMKTPDPSKAADFLNTRAAMSAPRYRR